MPWGTDPASVKRRQQYQADWKKQHKDKVADQGRKLRDAMKDEKRAIRDAALDGGCLHCGETHPACLQFHHRDPATKKYDITWAFHVAKRVPDFAEEIAKCDVLCANCHAKLHWSERNG